MFVDADFKELKDRCDALGVLLTRNFANVELPFVKMGNHAVAIKLNEISLWAVAAMQCINQEEESPEERAEKAVVSGKVVDLTGQNVQFDNEGA